MADDKMQDVFPITYEFVEGEQPSAEKLTGNIKQTDVAFSRITSAIGDLWEYSGNNDLSPQRLAQASLARFIGPSDWISPSGASWNETSSGIIITLASDRNEWNLGFPLVKIKNSSTVLSPTSSSTDFAEVDWDDDVTLNTHGELILANEKNTYSAVDEPGDFYVDFTKGVITSYSVATASITLTIDNFSVLGAGVPWGSANIIPTWDEISAYCTIAGSGIMPYTSYILTLPSVSNAPRATGQLIGALKPITDISSTTVQSDVTYNISCPGDGTTASSYRMPYSIINNYSENDTIPAGFMYLWDDTNARIIPNITFKYKDEYSVVLSTAESYLDDYVGASLRLIISGTSLSEAVGYLLSTTRDNRHVGLTYGQNKETLAFTNPISHDHLTNLYSGSISSTYSSDAKWLFTKSKYPTNPHPQYLHRTGYMESDEDGNSGNSMRGDIVFSEEDTYDPDSRDSSTYGIRWGDTDYMSLRYRGGVNDALRVFYFGLDEIGANPTGSYAGALTFTPSNGHPLYIKGDVTHDTSDQNAYAGAVLAMDLGNCHELNYIKVMSANRGGTSDTINMPARTGQASWDIPLYITPGLDNRLSKYQLREFRFRGVPYVSQATNNSGIKIDGRTVTDLSKYFTSPGIVGADWFNCYSNAIFFSDTGDGKLTSLHTERGSNWMNDETYTPPTGIYYKPDTGSGASFVFAINDSSGSSYISPLTIGFDYGTSLFTSELSISSENTNINASSDITLDASDAIYIHTATNINDFIKIYSGTPTTTCDRVDRGDIYIGTSIADIFLEATDIDLQSNILNIEVATCNITLDSYSLIASTNIDITSTNDVITLSAGATDPGTITIGDRNIDIDASDIDITTSGSGGITLTSQNANGDIVLNPGSNGDIWFKKSEISYSTLGTSKLIPIGTGGSATKATHYIRVYNGYTL